MRMGTVTPKGTLFWGFQESILQMSTATSWSPLSSTRLRSLLPEANAMGTVSLMSQGGHVWGCKELEGFGHLSQYRPNRRDANPRMETPNFLQETTQDGFKRLLFITEGSLFPQGIPSMPQGHFLTALVAQD